jgi:serine/threonine protein kinase
LVTCQALVTPIAQKLSNMSTDLEKKYFQGDIDISIYFDNIRSEMIGDDNRRINSFVFIQNHFFILSSSFKMLSRYRIINAKFAESMFGSIMLAEDKVIRKRCIIKRLPSSINSIETVREEIEIGKMLDHKHIVKLILFEKSYTHEMPRDDSKPLSLGLPLLEHYLVFEYIEGVDLFEYLDRSFYAKMNEKKLKQIFTPIVDALHYCHGEGVAHRDLKLENIMIEDKTNKPYLIDFGLGIITGKQRPTILRNKETKVFYRPVGSFAYAAPELIQKEYYCPFKADIWSLGTCIYSCAFCLQPWDEKERIEKLQNNEPQPHLTLPCGENLSDSFKELLFGMMNPNPLHRLSIVQVKNHPWFQS